MFLRSNQPIPTVAAMPVAAVAPPSHQVFALIVPIPSDRRASDAVAANAVVSSTSAGWALELCVPPPGPTAPGPPTLGPPTVLPPGTVEPGPPAPATLSPGFAGSVAGLSLIHI